MTFEEWRKGEWVPDDNWDLTLGDMESAWQAAHAEGVAEGRAAERGRCVTIAAKMDCELPPSEFMMDHVLPVSDWERAQCWHGDKIAKAIKEADDE